MSGTRRRLERLEALEKPRERGEDVPPHPLGVAAADSPNPKWSRSLYSAGWVAIVAPPEDLSE